MQMSPLGTGADLGGLMRSGRANSFGAQVDRLAAAQGPEGEKRRQLRGATQEFESLFVSMLMDSMRKTIKKSGFLDGGHGEEVFQSLQDVELSKGISKRGGLGIGDMLYKTLSRQLLRAAGPETAPEAAPAPDRGTWVDTAA